MEEWISSKECQYAFEDWKKKTLYNPTKEQEEEALFNNWKKTRSCLKELNDWASENLPMNEYICGDAEANFRQHFNRWKTEHSYDQNNCEECFYKWKRRVKNFQDVKNKILCEDDQFENPLVEDDFTLFKKWIKTYEYEEANAMWIYEKKEEELKKQK